MSAVEIVAASPAHVGTIANRMRAIDRLEAAAFGHSPRAALRAGLQSGRAWTVRIDGRPEAMFGATVTSAIEGLGQPWMLGTDAVLRHGRDLLGIGPRVVAHLSDSTPRLENLVSAANGRAIRLLGRWGFTVEREEVMIGGTPFRKFWLDRTNLSR